MLQLAALFYSLVNYSLAAALLNTTALLNKNLKNIWKLQKYLKMIAWYGYVGHKTIWLWDTLTWGNK